MIFYIVKQGIAFYTFVSVIIFFFKAYNTQRIMTTQEDLVRQLRKNGYLKTETVIDAMLSVDRQNFCKYEPYVDAPQSIGYAANISAPHVHAQALEMLKTHLVPGATALDVGSGSGYLTACMALMIGPTGRVFGMDHIKELVVNAVQNVIRDNSGLFHGQRVKFLVGDGRLGYPKGAPYNAIYVGATVSEMPLELIRQLKRGGRMIVPIGPEGGEQYIIQVDKAADGSVSEKKKLKVFYLPLTDLDHQLNDSLKGPKARTERKYCFEDNKSIHKLW